MAFIYNNLVTLKTAMENAYSNMEVQQSKRWDLIPDLQKYVVTVRAGDGTMRQISPIAFGDLFDNDNNHLLALDTPDEVVSVMAIEGWVVDPNHDLNPETTVNLNSS